MPLGAAEVPILAIKAGVGVTETATRPFAPPPGVGVKFELGGLVGLLLLSLQAHGRIKHKSNMARNKEFFISATNLPLSINATFLFYLNLPKFGGFKLKNLVFIFK
jgi:hypothetical protein